MTVPAPLKRCVEVVSYVANHQGQWKQMKVKLEYGHIILRPIKSGNRCRCLFCWLGDTTGNPVN